jgi:hypothetical protein
MAFEATVLPTAGAAPGRYFIAAQIEDGGQLHEDVLTIDHRLSGDGVEAQAPDTERSALVRWAVARAMASAGIDDAAGPGRPPGRPDPSRELVADLLVDGVLAAPGDDAVLGLSLRNLAASQIRGEAQVLSPFETWTTITPWTQGFVVEAGGRTELGFRVAPPRDAIPGTYWALVKVMYFGRILYTASVPLVIRAPKPSGVLEAAGAR